MHNLLNSLCTPTSTPDETGIMWTSDIVRVLCEMHQVSFVESSLRADSTAAETGSTVARKVWNRLGKRLAPSAREPIVSQSIRPTKTGMCLFYDYMLELVKYTIPFESSTRMILVDDLQRDLVKLHGSPLVESNSLFDRVQAWIRWIEKESHQWIDSEKFVMGAKISLYGDHAWVKNMYWSEFVGRPWSDMSRIKSKE